MKTSMCMAVWDEVEKLKVGYTSLCNNTSDYELILVDNGAFPDVKDYLYNVMAKNPNVKTIIKNEKNLGFGMAMAQAEKEITTPYFFMVESDVDIKTKDWDQLMIEHSKLSDEIGMVVPHNLYAAEVGWLSPTTWGMENTVGVEFVGCYVTERLRKKVKDFFKYNKSVILEKAQEVQKLIDSGNYKSPSWDVPYEVWKQSISNFLEWMKNPITLMDPGYIYGGILELTWFITRILGMKIADFSGVDIFHNKTTYTGPNVNERKANCHKTGAYCEVRGGILNSVFNDKRFTMVETDYHVKMGESIWFRHKDQERWNEPPENLWECDSVGGSQTMRCHLSRYEFSKKIIGQGKEVLDLACGTGYGCDMLQKAGNGVVGVDYDPMLIDHCGKTYPKCGFACVDLKLDRLPFDDQSFDVVNGHAFLVWDEVFIKHLITEVLRVLRPGGLLILSSRPSYSSYLGDFDVTVYRQDREVINLGVEQNLGELYTYNIYVGRKK